MPRTPGLILVSAKPPDRVRGQRAHDVTGRIRRRRVSPDLWGPGWEITQGDPGPSPPWFPPFLVFGDGRGFNSLAELNSTKRVAVRGSYIYSFRTNVAFSCGKLCYITKERIVFVVRIFPHGKLTMIRK